jgi:hypothetical protein
MTLGVRGPFTGCSDAPQTHLDMSRIVLSKPGVALAQVHRFNFLACHTLEGGTTPVGYPQFPPSASQMLSHELLQNGDGNPTSGARRLAHIYGSGVFHPCDADSSTLGDKAGLIREIWIPVFRVANQRGVGSTCIRATPMLRPLARYPQ